MYLAIWPVISYVVLKNLYSEKFQSIGILLILLVCMGQAALIYSRKYVIWGRANADSKPTLYGHIVGLLITIFSGMFLIINFGRDGAAFVFLLSSLGFLATVFFIKVDYKMDAE